MHDITTMNYRAQEDEKKNREFLKIIAKPEYEKLSFTGKEYSVIIPQSVKEVVSEGKSLSHCVASYVDDIIKEKCKILFMRETKNPTESLVTIEIRGDKIRQKKVDLIVPYHKKNWIL